MTGDSDKGYGTNKPLPTGTVQERSKGDTTCPTPSQNPPRWHPSWLSNVCTTRKGSESEGLAKDNPETNPIIIKPETESHVAEQSSWFPSSCCSSPRRPFPIKSLALSAHVYPIVRQEPSFGPWKGSLFPQQYQFHKSGIKSGYPGCLLFLVFFFF